VAEEAVGPDTGRGRLIAFRVVSVLVILLALSSWAFVVASFTDEVEKIHRVHNLAGSIVLLAFVAIPLGVGVARPKAAVAPFRVLLASCLAMIVAGMIAGDLVSGTYFILPLLAAILLALHPARTDVWDCVRGNVAMLLLGILALIPAFLYALQQGDLQKAPPLGMGVHAEFHHFSGMGFVMLSLGLAAMAAAFPGGGQRLAVWLTGLSAIALGVVDLALAGYVGSLNAMWAWVLIMGGAVFIVVGEMAVRRPVTDDAWLDET
jgi:hypothetical protein